LPVTRVIGLDYYLRQNNEVWLYSRPMGVAMAQLQRQIADARKAP